MRMKNIKKIESLKFTRLCARVNSGLIIRGRQEEVSKINTLNTICSVLRMILVENRVFVLRCLKYSFIYAQYLRLFNK